MGKRITWTYISGHPLDRLRGKLENRNVNIKRIKEEGRNDLPVTLAGIIESIRPVVTKKNERMAFIKIGDLTGSIETVIFPKIYTKNIEILVAEQCIAFSGKVSLRNGEKSIIIDEVKVI